MEWADLHVIDLADDATEEGRQRLAAMARDAMRTTGFFYVVNHGYHLQQVWVQNTL